jgi:formylglycine-generating enzyme required for sulfatase activity
MFVLAVAVVSAIGSAQADVFYMPAGQKSLEFVTVGDSGNVGEQSRLSYGDSTSYGAVVDTYRIGKYDVTIAQYCQFLNAVAKTDTYGLYNPQMAVQEHSTQTFYPTLAIAQTGSSGSYSYSITGGTQGSYSEAANCPIYCVSWGSAARFCNWLQKDQPSGAQGVNTTETGAYTLNGATTNEELLAVTRSRGAKYFLPSENQWYKAAFYKGGGTNAGYWDYPTKSNATPSNELSTTGANNANYYDNGYTDDTNLLTPVGTFAASPGPYGTYDMGGNLWQWNEAIVDGNTRGLRGGDCHLNSDRLASSFRDYNSPPADGWSTVTIRVASVPEPGSIAMLLAGVISLLAYAWRRTGDNL